jgi:shikimate kinase
MIDNLPETIFLCGFMGAGKSVIGQQLADELGRPFLDLDDKIEEKAGQSIPKIFGESGESGFRIIERKAVLEVIREFEGIVALGGGSIQNEHLLDHIKQNGLLIFIETPISVILDRISEDKNRPLLLNKDGDPKDRKRLKQDLTVLYEERMPLYEQADLKAINDGSESTQQIVEILVKKIKNHVE